MILSRRSLIAGGVGALTLPLPLLAEEFADTYAPKAEPIAEGIWLVRGKDEPIAFPNGGAIANAVFMATGAGTVLVDPGPSLTYGRALAALAQSKTGQPVTRVYVTHLHPDHSLGAAAFDPAIVHALPATRADLDRDGEGFSDGLYRILADWMKGTTVVLPRGDVAAGEVTFGGRALDVFALNGHSGSDLAILDKATGTLIAGDLVFHDRAPATPHADIAGWLAALDTLQAIPRNRTVPGHGPLDTGNAAIEQTRDWLTWLDMSLKEAVQQGMDMSEAGAMPIPDRFASMKVARYELQRSVSHFYPKLEAVYLPLIGD
ncbi:quinoprotein relay system zinc metallohydrolase 1 [Croceicoccus naphthovorans]|uniref:Hydrolase n=1 Tax=Croceicoccus naphthovorans TaxID=1348774 RepID=A0A0G3XK07_9SPHN|nr:quinoprotein relay system zinc metallohydrolase 1 [Croceicoccus naphthovorans]AKM10708.1 hydrolase [Croceicoccus naphthovorans]MBB3991840.1 quinoprotein relay system zinc metallohydrolase 1 [Croceicoccus naphthovorans]